MITRTIYPKANLALRRLIKSRSQRLACETMPDSRETIFPTWDVLSRLLPISRIAWSCERGLQNNSRPRSLFWIVDIIGIERKAEHVISRCDQRSIQPRSRPPKICDHWKINFRKKMQFRDSTLGHRPASDPPDTPLPLQTALGDAPRGCTSPCAPQSRTCNGR